MCVLTLIYRSENINVSLDTNIFRKLKAEGQRKRKSCVSLTALNSTWRIFDADDIDASLYSWFQPAFAETWRKPWVCNGEPEAEWLGLPPSCFTVFMTSGLTWKYPSYIKSHDFILVLKFKTMWGKWWAKCISCMQNVATAIIHRIIDIFRGRVTANLPGISGSATLFSVIILPLLI